MYLVKKTTIIQIQILLATETMAGGRSPEGSEIANVPQEVMAAAGMDQAPESRIRVIASNSHEAKGREG